MFLADNKWEQLYGLLGVKDFMFFISSPAVQEQLFPIKAVFILFAAFFFCAVIYFYFNSSYIRYQFLQDTVEFLSWQSYGLREVNKRLRKIMKKVESGLENDLKLAIIEMDDLLYQTLDARGYEGQTFEEVAQNAGRRMLPQPEDILTAHQVRNSIVYDPNYKLDISAARKILADYETAIKNITVS